MYIAGGAPVSCASTIDEQSSITPVNAIRDFIGHLLQQAFVTILFYLPETDHMSYPDRQQLQFY